MFYFTIEGPIRLSYLQTLFHRLISRDAAQIILVDTVTDTCSKLSLNRAYALVGAMIFLQDNSKKNTESRTAKQLAVMAYPAEIYNHRSHQVESDGYQFSLVNPMEIALSCYDLTSLNLVWENSFFSPHYSKIPKEDSLFFIESTNALISVYGYKISAMQASDGKTIGETETSSPILSGRLFADGCLLMCLGNGDIGIFDSHNPSSIGQFSLISFDLQDFTQINRFQKDATDYLIMPDQYTIWLCRANYDTAFVHYSGPRISNKTSIDDKAIAGDTIVFLGFDKHLYLYDLSEQDSGKEIELPGEYSGYNILGSDNNAGVVWINTEYDPHLFALNVSDGTIQEFEGDTLSFSYPKLMQNGTLVYWTGYPYKLVSASIQNGTLKETVLFENDKDSRHYTVRPDLKAVVMEDEYSKTLLLANLATGENTRLEDVLGDSLKQVVWQWSDTDDHKADTELEENLIAVTDGYEVVILMADGTELARLSHTGSQVINMTSYENELIVLYSGGWLIRYNWTDRTIIGRSTLAQYEAESFVEQVTWDFKDDSLYLTRYDGITDRLMHIINLETWEEEYFAYCEAFDTARDRIVAFSIEEDSRCIGYFSHYSLEDLRQRAIEELHGAQLGEGDREAYGLE